ncbi:MAG: hypothetical protein QG661_1238 [Actinomycetota bacterium]|jgi:uncharacterized membrane protein YccC|nr:hypothetical protein [Actinomycetota bacterium]
MYVRLAVLTALAAVAAYVIGEAVPFADPIPAAITAVIATRATFHHAAKETVFQTLGALLGAAIALAIVSLIGGGALVIFLLVLLCYLLARLLRLAAPAESPFVAASMAVTVILVVGTHLTSELALERFVGVVIGALCALAASSLATPTRDTRLLREDAEALQDALADLLSRVARGLREMPTHETAKEWRDEAVELRNRSIGLDARLEDLASHARWSPRIDPADLASLAQALEANRIMSSRVLSIAADLAASAAGSAASRIPQAALSPLADLIAMAADNMGADDPLTSIGRTQAHEAVRLADQTAQIALIGGIVSSLNRINEASSDSADAWDEEEHSAT